MIVRIPQRTKDDCLICVLAMIMGPLFPYERIVQDAQNYGYRNRDANGKFTDWWRTYFYDNGIDRVDYAPISAFHVLKYWKGKVVGMWTAQIPSSKVGHVVAVDEIGVVDPADGSPAHVPTTEYLLNRTREGFVFDGEWLAVQLLL
jgi:hypothetical protein